MTNTAIANALDSESKFTDSQVTPELREAGLAYLATYEGGFSYLVALKRRNPADLSLGQVRGVLNCVRAEILRANNDKFWDGVADGRYAITLDGKLRFFRVNSARKYLYIMCQFIPKIATAETPTGGRFCMV